MNKYLARWRHYGAGDWVYFELEAETEQAADESVMEHQYKNGYTPGDYDLYLLLNNE